MGKEQKKISVDEKVAILDRRINFLIGGAMGQATIVLAIIGLILNIKDNEIIFFKFIQNQYTLGILICFEIWLIYFVVKKTFKYLKTIEELKGITGYEDFLK